MFSCINSHFSFVSFCGVAVILAIIHNLGPSTGIILFGFKILKYIKGKPFIFRFGLSGKGLKNTVYFLLLSMSLLGKLTLFNCHQSRNGKLSMGILVSV